jgi:hypothetical protein
MEMKKRNIWGITLLVVVFGMLFPVCITAQNVLRVADFTAPAEKETFVPIYLDNSSEVVGLQFDITLPYKIGSGKVTLVDERSNGHSINTRKLSDTKYTVVVMSMQNRPLRGNSGLLIRFPVKVAADAQADDTKPVTLTDIVLTGRNGANVATQTTAEATFTVQRTPTPDFVVDEDFKIGGDDETLVPGGQMRLEFTVINQGSGDSKNGWSEKIYLEDFTGQRTYITAQKYGNTLPAGERMWRSYEVTLPQALHLEGEVMAVVELVALKSNDELIADQGNNMKWSSNRKTLEKRLFLSTTRVLLKEGNQKSVTLTRSGDWTMAETFNVSEYNDHGSNMLSLPATVTIPAKKAGVSFYVKAPDNNEVNPEYRTGLKVTGDDYPDLTMVVDVEDDDSYPLTLTFDKPFYSEGDPVTLTVSIIKALDHDLKVDIAKTNVQRFYPYIRSITIPAGQTSASAETAVVNDGLPMADDNVTFTATATGYVTAKCMIGIQDDDWPTLKMELSQTVISEGDGYGATMATVTRTGNVSENLTIYLNYVAKNVPAGANTKELFFDSQYVIIPAGQSSVSFPVSVEDNSLIDGTRVWTVTVAACDAATGKPVGAGHLSLCSADLTVTDDDTDKILKLQCSTATLPEAGKYATLTLTRNSNIGDETFNLTAEGADLEMPATVTIKNGSKTATFKVRAKADYATEDNYYTRVTASADDYQPTQFVFMVSTLPDAVGELPALAESNYYGGITYDITLNVTNKGTSTLEPGMEVYFYLLNKSVYNPDNPNLTVSDLFKSKLPQAVPAGETVPMTFSIELPTYFKEQQYWLMAWLNPRQKTAESNKLNGISNTTPINIKLPYTLESISTDRHNYTRGDVIQFTGKMSNAESGIAMEGKQVDVYMINDTKRYQTQGTLDAGGNFTAQYKVGEQTGGLYKVGACVHGSGSTDTQTTINVVRLKIERKNYLLEDITEGIPLEGDIKITNLSEEPVYDVTFKMIDLPEDWTVELTKITKLEGGATGDVHYRIIASKPPQAKKLISGNFIASAKTSDGQQIADSEMPVYFWWYAAKCKLVADKVNTTLYRLGQRQVALNVENIGLKESGSIRVECSSGQSWLSLPSTQLASIDKDGKATVTLNLTGNENLIVDGTYEALVRLTPENGDKLDVKVKCTVVSTDIGRLVVDVVDAYTLGADDGNGPHVSGATVRVTNAFNGEVAITGTTGEDGIFATDYETNKLKEGTYYVYVTAPNHFYAEKTITVEPGVDNPLEVFLNYETVKITYTVERTTVTDEYKTVLLMDIVPDIPQAIVVPDLPQTWGRGQHAFSITLTNKGRLTAYTPFLEFPNVDGVSFEVKSDYPSIIYPNESYDVTVEFTGPEDAQKTYLGYIKMHYAYKMRGDMHWGSETYMCTMGYGEIIILPGGGMPMAGSNMEGRNFGKYLPPSSGGALGGSDFVLNDLGSIGSREPEIVVRDYTKSIDNRIRLQFEQKFLLEREAFKGSLKVENLQMNAIEDVMMTPNVKRLDGTDATDLFSITTKGTGLWEGKDRWDLDSDKAGEALVLYVPSKETAPTEPVEYLFGGTVTYRNVADGKLVTVEVTPTKLTVNPSPDLHLTYFVQRDFIGDDPLTEEVEPWEPAQFALLIQNKGAGEAINLQIETSDPTIVDNACNLPVEFTKLYCTVDGVQSNMNFNKLDIGRIAPGQNIMARWWYYCNVAAHVANYEVYMTKHSNFGSEFDLITVDGVRELTRSVKGSVQGSAAGARRRAQGVTDTEKESNIFLLNLIPDEDNLPDFVIDQDGNETDDLEIVSENSTCAAAATSGQYTLTVTASRQGWVYSDIHDPTNCSMQLVKAVRQSDGADVTANIWQTDRTVTSNNSVIVDNRLHLADNIGTTETYTLFYEPKPAAAPQVKSIELQVSETTPEAKATSAIVTFAEAVDTNSLDAEDFVVSCGDMMYQPVVTVESSTSCLVNWDGNILVPGEYSLAVFTSGIKNAEGTTGTTNKSLNWISEGNIKMGDANRDGKVDITDARCIVDRIVCKPASVFIKEVADVNHDGVVDIADAVQIVNFAVGKTNALAPRHDGSRSEPE